MSAIIGFIPYRRERTILPLSNGSPLPIEQSRRERWLIRLAIYGDGVLLVLFFVLFPKDMLLTSGIWFVLTFAMVGMLIARTRRQARTRTVTVSPESSARARRDVARRLKRIVVLEGISAIVLAFAGIYNPIAFIVSGLLLLLTGCVYLVARKLSE